jgi:4-hydroxy-4-methyl-2-oxoglutarate aldolase
MMRDMDVLQDKATADAADRLRTLGTAHLTDACRDLGITYQLAGERLRPIAQGMRLAGLAVTLRIHLAPGPSRIGELARRQFALGRSVPAAVLVVRNEIPGYDTVGAFDARLAMASGYRGYLSDGSVRDTDAIRDLDFPVFATAVRPDCIRESDFPDGQVIGMDFGVPVDVAGIRVEPGMAVTADGDGVIVLPAERLHEVVDAAQRVVARESEWIALLESGVSADGVLSEIERAT